MFLTPTLGWVWLCGASDNKDSWPLISPVSFLLDKHLTGTTVSRASQYNEYGLNIRATHTHNLCSLSGFWWQPFRAYLFGTKGSLFSSWHFLGKSLLFYFFSLWFIFAVLEQVLSPWDHINLSSHPGYVYQRGLPDFPWNFSSARSSEPLVRHQHSVQTDKWLIPVSRKGTTL